MKEAMANCHGVLSLSLDHPLFTYGKSIVHIHCLFIVPVQCSCISEGGVLFLSPTPPKDEVRILIYVYLLLYIIYI